MLDFSQLFSSRSRIKILEVLYSQSEPMHLREIQALSGLGINPVNISLRMLQQEKLVRSIRKRGITGFLLNKNHPNFQSLSAVFSEMNRLLLIERKSEDLLKIKKSVDVWVRLLEMSREIKKLKKKDLLKQ